MSRPPVLPRIAERTHRVSYGERMKLRAAFARYSSVSASLVWLCAASSWESSEAMAKDSQSRSRQRQASSSSSIEYGVEHVPGGIDRVILTKRDNHRNVCVQVTLASPGVALLELPGELHLPSDWTLESAIFVQDATACGSPLRRWPTGAINATGISGSVQWGSSPSEKTVVDLSLVFPGRGSKPRATEKLVFKR